MRRLTDRAKDENGVALVVALIVLVVLMGLTAAVVSAAVNENGSSRRDTSEKRAFEAAQAGLQETLYRLNMVVNSNPSYSPTDLTMMCIGGQVDSSGSITGNTLSLESPAPFYGGSDCGPYTESLGNGAFYRTWTSIQFNTNGGTCAGSNIGTSTLVGERCITSQGIVCPPTYTSVSQLPCPNQVVHRVEERVASSAGKAVFPTPGVFGLNGVLVENSAQIVGNVATNLQLEIKNTAKVSNPASLAPAAPNPILQNSAQLGTLPCTATTIVFPTSCVTRASAPYQFLPPPMPMASYDPTTLNYSRPDGDVRISNAFLPCAQQGSCAHDTFSGCTSASTCGWNPTARTLTIPNGVTWTLSGAEYSFCSLSLTGSSTATLANGDRTALYIDSPAHSNSGCGPGTGYLSLGQQAQFINNSPPLPGSPLAHDTTALQIWVYGPSDVAYPSYSNNACVNNNSDPTCILLGNKGDFYGTLYAPTSDVSVSNQGNTYGGIIGSTVTYNNPGVFTQDVNDTSLVTTAQLAVYYRSGWSECQPAATSTTNPMSGC